MRFIVAAILLLVPSVAQAEVRTWDGQHSIEKIAVTAVYFVPSDRQPLPDWRERVDYVTRRLEQFHHRELQGQSKLTVTVHAEPLVSQMTTAELRQGDGDAIFFRTLGETDRRLKLAQEKQDAFPILLVLSDINWRPLDDFYRVKPEGGELAFEGNYNGAEHFPGAASGGARATYLADRGVGWGLVSADGWRVPYRGADCVVYHEGCGHTVGLPHPEPGNGSVMSLGQYQGWLSESWLDREQKLKLGWKPAETADDPQLELFSRFRALPEPRQPKPGEQTQLALDWPQGAKVKTLRVRLQTAIDGPWIEVPQSWKGDAPKSATLGTFDRATPVSYRVDAALDSGATAELWGYFQVRTKADQLPMPLALSQDLPSAPPIAAEAELASPPGESIDLLAMFDPVQSWSSGEWSKEEGTLVSPKQFGARLELPYSPPDEYRLTVIAEPLDEPNGLILGQRSDGNRFLTLVNYGVEGGPVSAIENVDGQNVGNPTTYTGKLLRKDTPSQVIVEVLKTGVTVWVDGRRAIAWKGKADRLSLSDYWDTPEPRALFIGAYDCRYRFHRITLEPLSGKGVRLDEPSAK